MLDLGLSVSDLARQIGHKRESVSRAIHRGANAGVLRKVEEALRG